MERGTTPSENGLREVTEQVSQQYADKDTHEGTQQCPQPPTPFVPGLVEFIDIAAEDRCTGPGLFDGTSEGVVSVHLSLQLSLVPLRISSQFRLDRIDSLDEHCNSAG